MGEICKTCRKEFDSDKDILLENLSKEQLSFLEERMLAKTVDMTKKDRDKHEIIYFLMSIAEAQGDKEKHMQLCERFRGILKDADVDYMKGEYEEGENEAD